MQGGPFVHPSTVHLPFSTSPVCSPTFVGSDNNPCVVLAGVTCGLSPECECSDGGGSPGRPIPPCGSRGQDANVPKRQNGYPAGLMPRKWVTLGPVSEAEVDNPVPWMGPCRPRPMQTTLLASIVSLSINATGPCPPLSVKCPSVFVFQKRQSTFEGILIWPTPSFVYSFVPYRSL